MPTQNQLMQFNVRSFWAWIFNGFYHSGIAYVVSTYFFVDDGVESSGQLSGLWVWGTTLYTAILLTVLGKAALITKLPPHNSIYLQ
jgi:phospholipid-transporting ATPase